MQNKKTGPAKPKQLQLFQTRPLDPKNVLDSRISKNASPKNAAWALAEFNGIWKKDAGEVEEALKELHEEFGINAGLFASHALGVKQIIHNLNRPVLELMKFNSWTAHPEYISLGMPLIQHREINSRLYGLASEEEGEKKADRAMKLMKIVLGKMQEYNDTRINQRTGLGEKTRGEFEAVRGATQSRLDGLYSKIADSQKERAKYLELLGRNRPKDK